jgi:hypothetical protein
VTASLVLASWPRTPIRTGWPGVYARSAVSTGRSSRSTGCEPRTAPPCDRRLEQGPGQERIRPATNPSSPESRTRSCCATYHPMRPTRMNTSVTRYIPAKRSGSGAAGTTDPTARRSAAIITAAPPRRLTCRVVTWPTSSFSWMLATTRRHSRSRTGGGRLATRLCRCNGRHHGPGARAARPHHDKRILVLDGQADRARG